MSDDAVFQYGVARERTLVDPFLVRYAGRDADRFALDATALGPSLDGGARVYLAVTHYCFFGDVPRGNYGRKFVCYAQPARPGSWDQFFYVAPLVLGHYQLHAELYNNAFSLIFGYVTAALKKVWTKPDDTTSVITTLSNTLMVRAKSDADVQQQLLAILGAQQAQAAAVATHQFDQLAQITNKLIDTIPQLAAATRAAAADFVKPVGRTCRTITPHAGTPFETEIGPSEAQAIADGPDTSVSDMNTYQISRIRGLNVVTGSCQLEVDGLPGPVRGKITDPALELPGNAYTKALNNHTSLEVDAKAVVKAGTLQSLFISNARTSE